MAGRIASLALTVVAFASASAAAQEATLQDLQKRVEELEKKGTVTKRGNSFFRLYGFLRLDAIFDDSAPNNTQTIGWVKSEDPTAPGGAKRNDESLTVHARLTRFGLDLDGGTVAALNDAKTTGKVEVDFYNSGLAGQSESRSALRMRHAYVNLDWGRDALLAGQTAELISPLWPVVNPDMIHWGVGNLGDRRPQVRWTRTMPSGNHTFTVAGMAGLTGAVDNQNLDGPGDTVRDGEESAFPTLQARVAYGFAAGKARGEVGAWGHYAREHTTAPFAGEDEFQSAAVGIDVHLPLGEKVYVKGEAWRGRNLDDVRGGVFQGVNTATGDEIHSQGGWAEVGFHASKTLLLAVGASEDNPRGGDLGPGGRNRNTVAYAAAHWMFDPVEFGIDFMHWKTEFKGVRSGLDNRIQAYIAYHF